MCCTIVQLFLHFSGIPFTELSAHEVFRRFVDAKVHWLQTVGTIGWYGHHNDVVSLKERCDARCLLAFEYIKESKCCVVGWKAKHLPFLLYVRNDDFFEVLLHFFLV